ncbi:MAG: TolC family protein [Treponema sp.]|jgi:outer membrane protein TolC|nr:TolC family protein [Treponema sp.]
MIQIIHGAGGGRFHLPGPAIILFLCALLCAAPGAVFAETRKLSLDEAVDLAIKNNLSLESARVTSSTKKRAADTAWNVFIPTVELSTTLGRMNRIGDTTVTTWFGGEPQSMTIEVDEGNHWSLSGNLAISFNFNFALFESMKNLKLNYQAGLITFEKARIQLERDIRKAYFQLLLLQDQRGLLQDQITMAERRVETAQANYRAGLVPELTLLQAQVSLANIKPTMVELENGIKSSIAVFAMNLGLPSGTEIELEPAEMPGVVELDAAALISRAASEKPDVEELRQNILVIQSARKARFYQAFTPNLSLGWNMDPTVRNPWTGDGWSNGVWSSSGLFRVTLSYSLNNLFPFGSARQGLADMDDNLRSLNIALAQTIRGTEVEIYSMILKLEKSQTSLEVLRQNADLAARAASLTEQAYRAGLQDLLTLQNSQSELTNARFAVVQEEYNYMMNLIDLEYTIGVPFKTLSGSIR